jgi:ABC-type dipeptide/oligopeptide/nickel transport system permease subunit
MTAPQEVTGSDVSADPDAVTVGMGRAIEGRSLGQIAWRRLRRDRVAMGGGTVIIMLILVAIFAPAISGLLGHDPLEFHYDQVDPDLQVSPAFFGGMSPEFLFGVEPVNGRDVFSRVVYGARISLLIAFFATLLAVLVGTVAGVVAGYFGGVVDTLISRVMDIFLAFPILLFALALVGVIPDQAFGLQGDALRIVLIVAIIGLSSWPYIGRIIRGQTLSLREREFVDAARSLGARTPRILFSELLPNLVAPILVYSTLLIPANILFEAALSFLGVGIRPPTPSWGGMLSDATHWFQVAPNFMVFPGLAIFVTVLAFNLFGDGLRDALDPRSR